MKNEGKKGKKLLNPVEMVDLAHFQRRTGAAAPSPSLSPFTAQPVLFNIFSQIKRCQLQTYHQWATRTVEPSHSADPHRKTRHVL